MLNVDSTELEPSLAPGEVGARAAYVIHHMKDLHDVGRALLQEPQFRQSVCDTVVAAVESSVERIMRTKDDGLDERLERLLSRAQQGYALRTQAIADSLEQHKTDTKEQFDEVNKRLTDLALKIDRCGSAAQQVVVMLARMLATPPRHTRFEVRTHGHDGVPLRVLRMSSSPQG